MTKPHNMASKELGYRFPCIILRTVSIPLDTIERGLIGGCVVFNDVIGDIFWVSVTGIRLESRQSKRTCLMKEADTSRRLRRICNHNWCVECYR